MADATCVLNGCGKPQGTGTWCSVDAARTPLPICEDHFRVLRDMPKQGAPCTQCGQRTPVCSECGDSIIFVPRSGFGNNGEWRHKEPPKVHVSPHMPRPRVFVS